MNGLTGAMLSLVRSFACLSALTFFGLFAIALMLVSCSGSDGDVDSEESDLKTFRLIVEVPAVSDSTETTRIGDPGTDTGVSEDWDCLTIIFAYTEKTSGSTDKMVYTKTISKDDFYSLSIYSGDNSTSLPTLRILPISVPTGTAYVYGVTYSSAYTNNGQTIQQAIEALETSTETLGNTDAYTEVEDLTISNDYASGLDNSTAKFLSVATGYFKDYWTNKTTTSTTKALLTISDTDSSDDTESTNGFPYMVLTRLASMIDIQWDAADSYTRGYTNVKVQSFQYDGGGTSNLSDSDPTSGYGRLFPDLVATGSKDLGGSATFYNTTEISQRNGRVYHYVYPDGVGKPSITFNITAKYASTSDDGTTNETTYNKDYTFNFASALQQATWYKINTTIVGNTSSSTSQTIDFSTSTTTTE
ncbi:MAG: hypothetical protein Q4D41_04040 [Prevotellaceae bacterium]|nr:hypothetical protein [Prevotellaceae bacterium]